jgi:hypothetical protein
MPFDIHAHTEEIMDTVQRHLLDIRAKIQALLNRHPDVKMAQNQALAAGVPWATILEALLPFVIKILAGGAIDWQAIVATILALINPAPIPLNGPNTTYPA